QGPLWRVLLFRLAEQDQVLLLTMHHIISDAWSLGVFVREVALLYQAAILGQPATLPELPIQYADYAVWQREWLQGEVLQQQLGYWKQQLAEAPAALDLPTDRPRPALQTANGAAQQFVLPQPLTAQLQQLSRQANATLYMTLLAAFQALLGRY